MSYIPPPAPQKVPLLLVSRLASDDENFASNYLSGTTSVSLKTILFLGGATLVVFVLLMLLM